MNVCVCVFFFISTFSFLDLDLDVAPGVRYLMMYMTLLDLLRFCKRCALG
jgi:hypothetical protein